MLSQALSEPALQLQGLRLLKAPSILTSASLSSESRSSTGQARSGLADSGIEPPKRAEKTSKEPLNGPKSVPKIERKSRGPPPLLARQTGGRGGTPQGCGARLEGPLPLHLRSRRGLEMASKGPRGPYSARCSASRAVREGPLSPTPAHSPASARSRASAKLRSSFFISQRLGMEWPKGLKQCRKGRVEALPTTIHGFSSSRRGHKCWKSLHMLSAA